MVVHEEKQVQEAARAQHTNLICQITLTLISSFIQY